VFTKAQRHLARRDPILKRLIAAGGPCRLRPDPDGFGVLARSIVSQQISSKAAESISARLLAALGKRGLTPEGVLRAPEAKLRSAGLSAAKTRSLHDLAEKVRGGAVPLDGLEGLTDEEVIARLLPVRGVGRWTAEMFLIFSLGRADVLPLADLGLRAGVRRHYGLEELPAKERLVEIAEPWRPYRTIGTWFIWKSFGPVPQSE
jgi:DNA-3-methyladenine glycosylase II